MDTKWNSTDSGPAEALEQSVAEQIQEAVDAVKDTDGTARAYRGSEGKARRFKTAVGFLAFVLGVSLTVGGLGQLAARTASQRDTGQWWTGNWQETDQFRWEISEYLKEFLTLGAGGELGWYSTEAVREYAVTEHGEAVTSVSPGLFTSFFSSSGSSASEKVPDKDPAEDNPDYYYENDKNVLYCIWGNDGTLRYENTGGQPDSLSSYDRLPEGYNFLLAFRDGRVSIWKDGRELDVYGDGIYVEDSQWFVPGYDNFPAGEGVESVAVLMAVRETPVQYYTGDYQNGGVLQNSRMYWILQSIRESQAFYLRQAVLLGSGVLCLTLWFALRRAAEQAGRKLAAWTVHIWTEARFLAVTLALIFLLLPRGGSMVYELWMEIRYGGLSSYMLPYIGRAMAASLENTAALLVLVWAVWLIHNDHRYNLREQRRSLWRLISVRLPRYSFQKQATRRNRTAALLACVLPVMGLLLAVSMNLSPVSWLFFVMVLIPTGAALLIWRALGKNAALIRDIGLLAEQVEAIRGGDLSTPLTLPADADLRQAAEILNDIQSGMREALAEQTRSERMKVELISNVSHDLKTPLTSILSYAELLRQEPLKGAAADYARIIDEKAQRLKSMVQDVFEVSKATAGQLPVTLERLDLAKLIRQTLADMDAPIQASRLTFKIDLPDTPVMITADGKRLYRVFQNLIQNALQYALEGSRVYLALKTGGGQAEASVRNISRTELPDGVDFTARFVRGDESRTDGGSGLGLSIASSFTEACGGAFRVETVADLFTAVVTFPLNEP